MSNIMPGSPKKHEQSLGFIQCHRIGGEKYSPQNNLRTVL